MSIGRVSVVVPVLNGEATIGDMLEALVRQAPGPFQTERLIVDNGSTDRTREIVRRFDVTLLEEPRRGPAAARNRGLRAARGEVIAHLDADTLPTRRWLNELVAPFSDPSVVITAGRSMSFRPETGSERYVEASGRLETRNTIERPVFPFAPSKNLAVRRDAALAIGGWNEEMLTAEDVDFCHRIQTSFETHIVYCKNALLLHRNRRTNAEFCDQAWSYGEGAADMYRRYPEVVRFDPAKALAVLRVITTRSAAALLARMGRAMRLVDAERVEFARYHALWTWWWWRGFFSMQRTGRRRPRP